MTNFFQSIIACGISGHWNGPDEIEVVSKGAYLLAIRIDRTQAIALPAGLVGPLDPGWYIYAGNARGPGGIAARVRRHFRTSKKIHWHIDRLTVAASEIMALAVPGGSECELVARLVGSGRFATAIEGFGSSDCRLCQSHLMRPMAVSVGENASA